MEFEKKGLQKAALSISGILTLLVTVRFSQSHLVATYERQIYTQYGDLVWVAFSAALITATIALMLSAHTDEYLWRSVILIITCYAVFFAIPAFRGYAVFGRVSDLIQHIAYAKTMLHYGEIPIGDIYPSFHILMVMLKLMGFPLQYQGVIFSIITSGLWIVSIGLLTRRITQSKHTATFSLVAAIPLALGGFHLSFQPAVKSFFLLPLALLCVEALQKTPRRSYQMLTVIWGISFVFLHPVTALLFCVSIFGVWITGSKADIPEKMLTRRTDNTEKLIPKKVVALIGIILSTWLIHLARGRNVIAQGILGLISIFPHDSFSETSFTHNNKNPASTRPIAEQQASAGKSILSKYLGYIRETNLTLDQLIWLFVERYAAILMLITMSSSILIYIYWNKYWKNKPIRRHISHLAIQHIIGIIIGGAFVALPLIVSNPIRVSRYVVLFATILVGVGLARISQLHSGARWRKRGAAVAIICILVLIPFTAMNAYPENTHMTYKEKRGIEYVIRHHNSNTEVNTYGMDPRQISYLLGERRARKKEWMFNAEQNTAHPKMFPKHLGYPNQHAAEAFGRGEYLVTKEVDTEMWKSFYKNQLTELTYYTDQDLERMEMDPTTDRIYSNGGFSYWLLSGIK